MSGKQNSIKSLGLKYLNIVFSVLMLVVLSLKIEQIVHNKRISKAEHLYDVLNYSNDLKPAIIDQYFKSKIVQGAILSVFLGLLSLVFAFKLNFITKYYKFTIPVCVLISIVTCLYFVFTLLSKLPHACTESIVKFDATCDADFEYNMENKIIPFSILMVLLVPQFIARSISILLNNCLSKSPNGSKKKQVSWNRLSAISTADTNHSNTEIELRMKELDNSDLLDGFREMPIDCYPLKNQSLNLSVVNCGLKNIEQANLSENNQINDEIKMGKDSRLMKLLLVNELNLDENNNSAKPDEVVLLNNNLFTKNNQNFSNEIIQSNIIYNNNLRSFTNMVNASNLNNLINRRSNLYRNSSLSTISEEKTLATLTDISLKNNKQLNNSYDASRATLAFKNYNAKTIIESLLDDFQEKSILINEMIKVFEPSSKHGNFNRNIPIRFSSPLKPNARINNKFQNSINMSYTSPTKKMVTYSPIVSINNHHILENDLFLNNDSLNNKNNLILFDLNQNEYEDDVTDANKSSSSDFSKSSTSINKLYQKKIRFVKRLKNRIETKSGHNLMSNQKNINNNPENNSNLKKRLSFEMPIENDLCQINNDMLNVETSSNNSLSLLENNNDPFEYNQKPNLIVNKDIEPVFF